MHFTREELEDIWNNKPYGYFTNLMKKINSGNFKKYTICVKPYRLIPLDGREMTIFSNGLNSAEIFDTQIELKKWAEQVYGENIECKFHTYPL